MASHWLHSKSPEETLKMATTWAKDLKPGTMVGLEGELGAGKTLFAKGIIHGLLKVDLDEITSPTFTFVEEYPGDPTLYHVDLYRMEGTSRGEDLPWDELFSPEAITLVEWPERLPELTKYCQFLLKFSKKSDTERTIEIHQETA